MTVDTSALDPVDEFVAVAARAAEVDALRARHLPRASAALCEASKRLLAANRHMAGWLTRFTSFRISDPQPADRFRALRDEFVQAQAGGDLSLMKWRCHELGVIFDWEIAPDLDRIFPGDPAARDEITEVFGRLRDADDNMVDFIRHVVVASIEDYVGDVLPDLDAGRLNAAGRRHLAFDRDTAQLMARLIHLAGALSGLVLRFAEQAGVDVVGDG